MEINEIIEQLRDLAKDRKSFFNDDDDDFYRQDYEAVTKAADILEALSKSIKV